MIACKLLIKKQRTLHGLRGNKITEMLFGLLFVMRNPHKIRLELLVLNQADQ